MSEFSWQEVGKIIGKTAPILGNLCMGNIPGVIIGAGSLIAQALGCETTPEAITKAIKEATPEQLIKLKEIESQDKAKLLDWQTVEIQAELTNVQSARAMQVESLKSGSKTAWAPHIISALLVIGFFAILIMIIFIPSARESQILLTMVGFLGGAFMSVPNFYLGSSLGSLRKQSTIDEAMGKITNMSSLNPTQVQFGVNS
jgi:hypothetical protein